MTLENENLVPDYRTAISNRQTPVHRPPLCKRHLQHGHLTADGKKKTDQT